eukprot:TRINITY_DN7724_c0_g2_i1.p1 TRINITY_DN7724_c0_g2~~TRINITY_DN7724_c0_g2_i1.p1  ORF type:complete len:282 (+),score=102.85 TRINITY_DN7724_c0_g2_i1:64-909(+)
MRGGRRALLAKKGPGWSVAKKAAPPSEHGLASQLGGQTPKQMAEQHPSVLLAKSGRLDTYGITAANVKERTEQFYAWSRTEYAYKWAAVAGALSLVYLWWDSQDLRRVAGILGRQEAYAAALAAKEKEAEAKTAQDRDKVRGLLRDFLKFHPRPSDADLALLERQVTDVLNPVTSTAAEVWDRHLDRVKAEQLADLRAYERSQGLVAQQLTTSQVKIEGAQPGVLPTMTPVAHTPDSAQRARLDAAKTEQERKAEGAAMIEKFLALGNAPPPPPPAAAPSH